MGGYCLKSRKKNEDEKRVSKPGHTSNRQWKFRCRGGKLGKEPAAIRRVARWKVLKYRLGERKFSTPISTCETGKKGTSGGPTVQGELGGL